MSAEREVAEFGQEATIYAEVDNALGEVSYQWFVNGSPYMTTEGGAMSFVPPAQEGEYKVTVRATSETEIIEGSILITVMVDVPAPPVITLIAQDAPFYYTTHQARLICRVMESESEKLTYTWTLPSGTFEQQDSLLLWNTPSGGLYSITCTVTNVHGLSAEKTVAILVKEDVGDETDPMAYYPLNNDVDDYSGNGHHARVKGTQQAPDAEGHHESAYRISSGEDVIYVPNQNALNFTGAITLSFWVAATPGSHEAFILSHGSWEDRWKVSITTDGNIRWTVKTDVGVRDLDSSFPIVTNQYYHVAVAYTGSSLEMYVDGVLDSYVGHAGAMQTTDKSITFGQKSEAEIQYYLNGVLDEVKIFDVALDPSQISMLKSMWQETPVTAILSESKQHALYPNPTRNGVVKIGIPFPAVQHIDLVDFNGRRTKVSFFPEGSGTAASWEPRPSGIYILEVRTRSTTEYFKVRCE